MLAVFGKFAEDLRHTSKELAEKKKKAEAAARKAARAHAKPKESAHTGALPSHAQNETEAWNPPITSTRIPG